MAWLAPLLQFGTGILGAALNANERKKDRFMNSPQGIRKNAEAAGFNPLLFTGPGTGTGAQYAPTMGNIIANTGAAMAGTLTDQEALKMQKAQLDMENQRLTELVERTTLRPDVPGIYGARDDRLAGRDTIDSASPSGSPYPQDKTVRAVPERDAYNLYVDVYDSQTDRWVSIPNPDLMESGPIESTYAMAQIGAADVVQNLPTSAKKKEAEEWFGRTKEWVRGFDWLEIEEKDKKRKEKWKPTANYRDRFSLASPLYNY